MTAWQGISSKFAPPWHGTAREIKNYLGGSIWDSAYKFPVIRNPWDWQVSIYTYMLKWKTHHQHKFISKIKSFDEYISWRRQENFCSQSCFLTGDSGNIIVNDIFRFESINSDIQRLESHIGCNIHLKKLNQSRSDSRRQYYSSESREMVGKFFREDIDRFGYEFWFPPLMIAIDLDYSFSYLFKSVNLLIKVVITGGLKEICLGNIFI